MIIVSQDRTEIHNFDTANYIQILTGKTKQVITVDGHKLAEYKTEERAKEVLKEITRYYRMYQGIKFCNDKVKIGIMQEIDKAGQDAYIYTMPED